MKKEHFRSVPWIKIKTNFKRITAKVVFFFTGIIILKRKNELNQRDVHNILLKIRRGDIILAGKFKDTGNLFIPGAVTHSAIYIGSRMVIHAVRPKVEYKSMQKLLHLYDTMVILRIPLGTKRRWAIIHDAIKYAKGQIGKRYGFNDDPKAKKYFCSELVNTTFKKAGHKTKLLNYKKFGPYLGRIEKSISKIRKALRPDQMIWGNFRVIFLSHNLAIKKKKLVLKNK